MKNDIKKLRKEAGLRQEDLEKQVGVSRCGNGFRTNEPHHFVIERFRSAAESMYFIDRPAEFITDGFLQRISPFLHLPAK